MSGTETPTVVPARRRAARCTVAATAVGLTAVLGALLAPVTATADPGGPRKDDVKAAPAPKPAPSAKTEPTKAAKPAKPAKPGPSAGASSGCGENDFLDAAIPAAGTPVGPGSVVGMTYDDESPLDLTTLVFTVDGAAVVPTPSPASGGKHVTITYTLPGDLPAGSHTAYLYAEDTDQNKSGGDCGTATWTFGSGNGGGWGLK